MQADIFGKIDGLAELQSDWDGYGGLPISREIIDSAKGFARRFSDELPDDPTVAPMSKGRLQIEWSRGTRCLELEFADPDHIHYLKLDSDRGLDQEAVISVTDRASVIGLLDWFRSPMTGG